MILEEHFTLANGVNIPKLGLGTWRIDDSCRRAGGAGRHSRLAIAISTPPKPMRTSTAWAKACAPAASRETRCS